METGKEHWRKHPRYLADMGGLFGAPPRLQCRGCKCTTHELFYGHCQSCTEKKDIPREMAEPQAFHDAAEQGASVVIEGIPATFHPWWHWRRWFGRKN